MRSISVWPLFCYRAMQRRSLILPFSSLKAGACNAANQTLAISLVSLLHKATPPHKPCSKKWGLRQNWEYQRKPVAGILVVAVVMECHFATDAAATATRRLLAIELLPAHKAARNVGFAFFL